MWINLSHFHSFSLSHFQTLIFIMASLLVILYVVVALASSSYGAAIVPHPMITAPPSLVAQAPSKVQERNIISDIEGLGGYLSEVVGTFPSYIASGVPNFFQDFPTGSAVQKSLGISDSDLAAMPTQVLNIPYVPCFKTKCQADQHIVVTQIGQTKAGICDFTAMSSNSLKFPNQNLMT